MQSTVSYYVDLVCPPQEMDTISEVFVNGTLAPERLYGAFGVCYVAFAGTHTMRYRGERLMEVAARQVAAAAAARGATVPQCVVTDQPERSRPYLQLSVALRTPLDAGPFLACCERYTNLFNRPCKLLFGYMAKVRARPEFHVQGGTPRLGRSQTHICMLNSARPVSGLTTSRRALLRGVSGNRCGTCTLLCYHLRRHRHLCL